jgi:hypothetical protein
MAEEQGDKNVEISDADTKMSALMDMIKDACSMMDSGIKRLDARMDAHEARMDSMRKDAEGETEEEKKAREDKARKDAEAAEGKEKGAPEEVAADKARKDAEEAEAKKKEEEAAADKARKDAARRDAEGETEEEKKAREDKARKDAEKNAVADAGGYVTRAEAAALQSEIARLQGRVPALISDSDRERFARIQEEADPVFQAFNDRAPGPLDGETPTAYKRRLGSKLQAHSPKWREARLGAVSDEAMLDTILADVYADSMVAARAGTAVPVGTLRKHVQRTDSGHTIITYDGESASWMNQFAGHSQKGTGNWKAPNA